MNLRRTSLILVLLAVIGVAGWYYYGYQQAHPSTSDAYLGMHVARIATQVSGPVASVPVHSHQVVSKGDLLFSIDPAPFELSVEQASARLTQAKDALNASDAQVTAAQAQQSAAEAELRQVQQHTARVRDLLAKGTASKDEGDTAERELKDANDKLATAKAQLAEALAQRGTPGDANAAIKSAEAALAQARLDLAHTRVTAPADGILGDVDLRPGDYLDSGSSTFALVETGDVWVDANFKETDLVHVRPGQSATVTVDLLPGRQFRGKVESLSPASGAAFALLPPENATGNWVKVTQRFPVRIRVLDPVPGLRVGASSEVTVDTASPASPSSQDGTS